MTGEAELLLEGALVLERVLLLEGTLILEGVELEDSALEELNKELDEAELTSGMLAVLLDTLFKLELSTLELSTLELTTSGLSKSAGSLTHAVSDAIKIK